MKKVVDYVLSAIYLLHFGLTIVIFHVIQVVAYNVFGKKAHKVSVDYLNFFLNFGLYLMGGSIKFRNLATIPEKRPVIFVANHQSMYDIPGISWFLRKYRPRFVSKIELAKGIPSISYNLIKGESAIIDRKDGKKALIEIARLGKLIHDEKLSAVIFPEGTRTASGNMKPFQVGGVATLLKKAPDALIVPVAVNGTGKLNPKGLFPLRSFTRLSWTVLPGLEPSGKKLEDVLLEAQEAIRSELVRQGWEGVEMTS